MRDLEDKTPYYNNYIVPQNSANYTYYTHRRVDAARPSIQGVVGVV